MKQPAIFIAFALFSFYSLAESSHQEPSDPLQTVEPAPSNLKYTDVIVTVNRYSQDQRDSIADTSIVTKAEIAQMQANSFADVIKRLPGVQLSYDGGVMQSKSLFVRGLSSKYTLVLMDGVRLNTPTAGSATLSALPLSGVERIEFIRGPRAAVYGADAVAGVINIITEPFIVDSFNGSLEGGFGSNRYYQSALALNGSVSDAGIADKVWGKLVLSTQGTNGYNVQPQAGYINPDDFDNDGGQTQQILGNIGIQWNDQWQLKLNGFYNRAYAEFDANALPYYPNTSIADATDGRYYTLSTQLAYQSERYQSSLTLAQTEDKQNSFNQNEKDKDLDGNTTNRKSVAWFNHYQLLPNLTLGAGVDWSEEKVGDSITLYEKDNNNNTGLYSLVHYELSDQLTLEGNVRYDDNQNYGDYTTWQFGSSYRFTPALRLRFSAGTAFIAPTFSDLYYPSSAYYVNNPDLKVEESNNYEIALDGYNPWFTWRISGFYNRVDHLITYDTDPVTYQGTMVNINHATIKGMEFSASFMTSFLQHEITLNYLDARDDSTDLQLIRRAKESVNWHANYHWQQWDFDLNYLYQGARYDNYYDPDTFKASRIKLEPYHLVDLAVTYNVTNYFAIKGRVANLLNSDYETVYGYKTPEREYFLSFNYQF